MTRSRKARYERVGTTSLGRLRVARPAESQRPRPRRFHLVLLAAIGAIVAGALWIVLDDRFYIPGAEVIGAVRTSPSEIVQASGLRGLHILWARPQDIETQVVAAMPMIERARVACGFPTQCTITVTERQPSVMWDDGAQLWWVDSDGVVLPAQGQLSEGWLVRGPVPRDEDGNLDHGAKVALAELWGAGASVFRELEYAPGRGLLLIDERGWRVIVGVGEGMAERLRLLDRLADDLTARGLTPRFVDVRFLDAPYYSLSSDW